MTYISVQSVSRVKLDKFLDKIPLVSTLNNVVNFAQKITTRNQTIASKDHYYAYIKEKSILRCVLLSVPVLGQITVYLYDFYKERKANALFQKHKLEEAAELGNCYALLKLGMNYEIGVDVPQQDKKKSFEFYKQAAEKGNVNGFLHLVMDREDSEYLQAFLGNSLGLSLLIKKQSGFRKNIDLIREIQMWTLDYLNAVEVFDNNNPELLESHKSLYNKIVRISDIAESFYANRDNPSPFEENIRYLGTCAKKVLSVPN